MKHLLPSLLTIAQQAGDAILSIYHTDFLVDTKQDDSPVTQADLKAHQIIVNGLRKLTPDIPIISEEDTNDDYSHRMQHPEFWLIDPLDGTKEFVKRNDEFTVNIAYIKNHQPIFGIVTAPALALAFWGGIDVEAECSFVAKNADANSSPFTSSGADTGTYTRTAKTIRKPLKRSKDGPYLIRFTDQPQQPCQPNQASNPNHAVPHNQQQKPPIILTSRSHRDTLVNGWLTAIAPVETRSIGSSLKLCALAEGSADFYPRFAPTSEWDIAAGHAILKAVGGDIISTSYNAPLSSQTLPSSQTLCYGHKADIINNPFLAYSTLPDQRQTESFMHVAAIATR